MKAFWCNWCTEFSKGAPALVVELHPDGLPPQERADICNGCVEDFRGALSMHLTDSEEATLDA